MSVVKFVMQYRKFTMELIRAFVIEEHRRRALSRARKTREAELRANVKTARADLKEALAREHPECISCFFILDDDTALQMRRVQSQRALSAPALCRAVEQVQEGEVRARYAELHQGNDENDDPSSRRVLAWWQCVLRHAHHNSLHHNVSVSFVRRGTLRPRTTPRSASQSVSQLARRLRTAEEELKSWKQGTEEHLRAIAEEAIDQESIVQALGELKDGTAHVRVGLSNGQSQSYSMKVKKRTRYPVTTAAHLRRATTHTNISDEIAALHAAHEHGNVHGAAETLLRKAREVGTQTAVTICMKSARPTL
jgi:hypothetical protein